MFATSAPQHSPNPRAPGFDWLGQVVHATVSLKRDGVQTGGKRFHLDDAGAWKDLQGAPAVVGRMV